MVICVFLPIFFLFGYCHCFQFLKREKRIPNAIAISYFILFTIFIHFIIHLSLLFRKISHHFSTFFRLFDCFRFCSFFLSPGESLAELYHGNAVSSQIAATLKNWLALCIPTIIFILNRHCHRFISKVFSECW